MVALMGERPLNKWLTDEDVQLMLRVQRDEQDAFAELLARFWPRVFGRFLRQFGDRQEAEDLAQDVFLRVYRNRHRYRAKARFTTWLFHIAGNVARNAVRGKKRRPTLCLSSLRVQGLEPPPTSSADRQSPAGLEGLERAESERVVRKAMRCLASRQREALELQFQQRSYTEIAAELRMSPKAAKSLLYRARLQLRESLHPFMAADLS